MPVPWKGALLVSGEPGSGKSRWIREEATVARANLFRWNARTDRSLREGREKLHQQVRSKERLFIWIEGADDLTQEAQAFLRRILETASPSVTCCLEVREVWKLSPPILSRCTIIGMKADQSFRSVRNDSIARQLGLPPSTSIVAIPVWSEIPALRKRGEDPYAILKACIAVDGITTPALQRCLKMIGSGSSPWIQLACYLYARQKPDA
jgi:DNA polymerase III delta prime subunit